jgi:chemotaxis protein histidine kinase CheA
VTTAGSGSSTEFLACFKDESDELLRAIFAESRQLERSLGGDADPETVNALFRALHTLKGNAGILGHEDIRNVAHRLENLCELLRDGRITLSGRFIALLLAGRSMLDGLVAAVVAGRSVSFGVEQFCARLDEFAASCSGAPAPRTRAAAPKPAARYSKPPVTHGASGVALGSVFERFPQLVRDLAEQSGKRIDLATSGARVQVDRRGADDLAAALMHLVHNCVDHGVETPLERAKAGKPAAATITLHAEAGARQVLITVADDGAGIDIEKVRATALRDGLLGKGERPAERELIELTFTPGLSTAEAVTGTSGRGVGLDVVRANIHKLGGTVEITSARGRGTTVTIKLPRNHGNPR